MKAEGPSSWDPATGEWKKQGSQVALSTIGGLAAPWKLFSDDDLTGGEKAAILLNPARTGEMMKRRSERIEQRRVEALNRVKRSLTLTPKYERSQEAGMMQDMYSQSADTVRGIGDEAIRVAGSIASKETPGLSIKKEQLNQYAQAAIDDIVETGGGSSSLGAVTKTRDDQYKMLAGIAMQDAEQQRGNQAMYMDALMNRSGVEAQAAGLQGAGLQTGINEAGKEYQGQMERVNPFIQFAVTRYGNQLAQG